MKFGYNEFYFRLYARFFVGSIYDNQFKKINFYSIRLYIPVAHLKVYNICIEREY